MKKTLKYQPGDVVIMEGVKGKGFFILKKGVLEVYKDNVRIAQIDEPNTVFGEMSDILDKPRTCNIVAKTKAEVMHVIDGVNHIIENDPKLTIRLLRDIAARLESTTKRLADAETNLLWTLKR